MDSRTKSTLRLAAGFLCAFLACRSPVFAQASGTASGAAPGAGAGNHGDLDAKIEKLTQSLDQTRAELDVSRTEIRELRSMLEQILKKEEAASGPNAPGAAAPSTAATSSTARSSANGAVAAASEPSAKPAQISEDDWQILNARVAEIQQDKVESASKYRLKLSGMVLATAFANSGQVDNLDVPTVAVPSGPGESSGSAGGSLRQSIIGLTAIGPHLLGASTEADLQMDFFGGLPSGYGGISSGVARLRIARVGFAWENTSLIAGLDTPFFSPNMPSTYLSVAVPAFAAAGNLWTWTPQIRVERRIATDTSVWKVEAGLMDAPSYGDATATSRNATPGESSRQPLYAVRLSTNGKGTEQPRSLGVSGIYFPQRYRGGYKVAGWGAVGDWKVPFLSRLEWSGEMFVGKGLDVFGGVPQATLQAQNSSFSYAAGPELAELTMFGGWTQLKFRFGERSEINAAVGSGGRVAGGVREVAALDPDITGLSPRNDMFLVNYIFHARSDIVIAPEFRRYRTYQVTGSSALADQVGIALGYLF